MSDTPFLLPHHQELIDASAITREIALARGYRSVTTKAELRRLGFSAAQCRVPALLVPVWSVHGEIATYQARPDEPRIVRGKPIKYETPKGSGMVVDVPPAVRDRLADPAVPLLITEGVRKADSAVSHDLCSIALLGVWNWRGTNAHGGKTVLPDFEAIALNGRDVFLCFDSDVMTKPAVRLALDRLAGHLASRGAHVRLLLLPMGEGGTKTGLDDYLAAGHTATDLLALAVDRLPGLPGDGHGTAPAGPYRIVDGGIAWVRPVGDDEQLHRLTNFTAEILEEVVADDGQTEQGELVIRGCLDTGEPLRPIRVPTHRFDGLQWVAAQWGVRPIIAAGQGGRDRVREAIQRLSPDIAHRVEYTHPGWREIDGTWHFLTQETVIGPQGAVEGIVVRLPGAARQIQLRVPTDSELQEAVAAFLGLLTLAPDRLMIPLLGGVLRALLNTIAQADLVLFLAGPSGVLKSELAAVIQRCFGPGFDRLHLPASWSSTPNALERIAFDFKDSIVVVDDFAPAGTVIDVRRAHATAERVIRGAGNAAGRERMQADGTVRASLPPRGLILGTGEDIPSGYSIRARMLVLEVGTGDVDAGVLTRYQQVPDRSLPSVMLGGYLRWLASQLPQVRAQYPAARADLRRQLAASGSHARTPDALAGIGVAWRLWARFAVERGGLAKSEAVQLVERIDTTLKALAAAQASHLAAENPVQRFLDLLAGALAAGVAHVAGPDGDRPQRPDAWGWRLHTVGTGEYERHEWRPQGRTVGWVTGDGLFLEPQAVYGTVQQFGATSGSGIAISAPTLWKRMEEAGLLRSTERDGRGTRYIRRSFAAARRKVIHLAADVLDPGSADATGTVAPATDAGGTGAEGNLSTKGGTVTSHADARQVSLLPGQSAGSHPRGNALQTDTGTNAKTPWNQCAGQAGQVGQQNIPGPHAGAKTCTRCEIRRTIWPSDICPTCMEANHGPAA